MKKPLRAVRQMSVVVNNTSELKRPSVEPSSLRLSPYLEPAALLSLD